MGTTRPKFQATGELKLLMVMRCKQHLICIHDFWQWSIPGVYQHLNGQ